MANPPKPTERRRKLGNPSKRPLREPVSIVPASDGPPSPPKGLRTAGKAIWAAVWADGGSWLAPSDALAVRLLAETADERDRWAALVDKAGPTFTTESGYVALNPGVGQMRVLERQMISILSLLGFTPADRARLGLAEVRRMSGLADLLERRRADIGR